MSLLVGISAPLFLGSFLWPVIWGIYLLVCRFKAQTILLIGAIFYGFLHQIPPIPTQEISGIFSPSCLQPHHSPFQKGLLLKGTFSNPSFSVPCSIYLRGEERPIANQSYVIQGVLQQRGPFDFVLKAKEWKPLPNSWSLAEMRYQTKERFRKLLFAKLPSPKVATFLSSLTTGDVEERQLRYEFGRVGLQHILAISGFHFGILIAFFAFCLKLFLSRFQRILTLFILVSAYYIFVGSSPAVERSYLTALFYLLSQLFNRSTSGLNLLGCAMGVELICNPATANNIGFQLSFLSCFAILLFVPPLEKAISFLLPKRNAAEIQSLTLLSKHGYLLSSFFRKALSLTLAVNLILFPLLLFHFHQFPLLGFLYNLFFPFLVGISLFLLLSSLIFHLLFPPIANLLYSITNTLSSFLLDLTVNPPLAIDFSIRAANIPISLVILYLLGLGLWRISCTKKEAY